MRHLLQGYLPRGCALTGGFVHQHLLRRSTAAAMPQAAHARAASFNGSGTGYMYPGYDAPAETPPSHSEARPADPKPAGYCRRCGSRMELLVPAREREQRLVCTNSTCGFVDYLNPKMVVGCVVEHGGKILMCRRGIEPCKGLWTVPAGFLEMGESTAAGAARETWEEANARVEIMAPYAHWDIPVIGQAYCLFRARLAAPFEFSAGEESLEARLFAPQDIPFDQVAFSSVAITLRCFAAEMQQGAFHVHHGTIEKVKGSAPNDPGTFVLKDHFSIVTERPVTKM